MTERNCKNGCDAPVASKRGLYAGLCLECKHAAQKAGRLERDRERERRLGEGAERIEHPPVPAPAMSEEAANGARLALDCLLDDAESGKVVLIRRNGRTYQLAEVPDVVELEL